MARCRYTVDVVERQADRPLDEDRQEAQWCRYLQQSREHHRGEKNAELGYTTWGGGGGGVELIYLRTLPQVNKKVP